MMEGDMETSKYSIFLAQVSGKHVEVPCLNEKKNCWIPPPIWYVRTDHREGLVWQRVPSYPEAVGEGERSGGVGAAYVEQKRKIWIMMIGEIPVSTG